MTDLDTTAAEVAHLLVERRREAHAALAALLAPPRPRPPAAPHAPPPDPTAEEYLPDPCPDCGVPWLAWLGDRVTGTDPATGRDETEPVYACRGCDHLTRHLYVAPDDSKHEVPDWHRLLGLARVGPARPVGASGPTDADLAALGCVLWSEADRTAPEKRPFGHVPWDRVRAECWRRWPDPRYWREPAKRELARELASRGGDR